MGEEERGRFKNSYSCYIIKGPHSDVAFFIVLYYSALLRVTLCNSVVNGIYRFNLKTYSYLRCYLNLLSLY